MTIFELIRRSERIRNKLRQMSRQGKSAATYIARCKKNKEIQRPNQAPSLIINKLPKELVVEILSRLPPKSFFRCKVVCKSWLALSADAVHLNKHLQPTMAGFFCNKFHYDGTCFLKISGEADNKVVDVDVMIKGLSSYDILRIHDCCNGLLLIEAFNEKAMYTRYLHVYNPATRNLVTVLTFKRPSNSGNFHQACSLAFDTRVHDLFHVVCFWSMLQNGETFNFMEIFSFERGKCISRKKLGYDTKINFNSRGTFVNGRVYRVTYQNEILSINPNKCSYQVMHMSDFENDTLVEVGQSKGHLHCLSLCDKEKLLSIWVLERRTQQEWVLKYRLSLHQIYSNPQPYCNLKMHFAFHPAEDIVFLPVGNDHFMSLDLITGDIDDTAGKVGHHQLMSSWAYTPCYLT